MTINTDRVRERLAATGLNPSKASREAGFSDDVLRNILSGKSKNARADTLSALARVLQCSVAYLLGDETAVGDSPPGQALDGPTPIRWLSVLHEVGAGYWVDAVRPVETSERGPVAPLERYAAAAQWLERVIGPGADAEFAPGDLVHVIAADDIGYAPRVGDYVILLRRDGGRLERSIRKVDSVTRASAKLSAPTTDPRYASVIALPGDGDSEIVGKVAGSYRPRD